MQAGLPRSSSASAFYKEMPNALKVKFTLKLFHSRCSKWEMKPGGEIQIIQTKEN